LTTIRAFVAVTLPAPAITTLSQTIARLAQHNSGAVRWTRPEAIHLTLRFLGDTAVERLPEWFAALDSVAAKMAPFELRLGGLGCFPNRRQPRVIWVGLQDDEHRAESLAEAIEAEARRLGWPSEARPFRAHLTLGRLKDGARAPELPWDTPIAPSPVPVREIHFMESQLRPTGPLYTVRHRSRLG
jgi:2'-5' RNA ligase